MRGHEERAKEILDQSYKGGSRFFRNNDQSEGGYKTIEKDKEANDLEEGINVKKTRDIVIKLHNDSDGDS